MKRTVIVLASLLLSASLSSAAFAEAAAIGAAVGTEKGNESKFVDKDGNPTYKKFEDGSFDWYTFNGFRRYHAECHVCHGPEGNGSTYAPPLAESLKTMSYPDFMQIVASGREYDRPGGQKSVMPALGDNKNVMCYIDDLYVYLRARADGALPGGRPARNVPRSEASKKNEEACFGG